ncbi:hypothetical protein PSPO01_04269 [Paraphaeosphaeria sporulosa]
MPLLTAVGHNAFRMASDMGVRTSEWTRIQVYGVVAQGPAFDSQYRVFRGANDDDPARTEANATTQSDVRPALTIQVMKNTSKALEESTMIMLSKSLRRNVQEDTTQVLPSTRRRTMYPESRRPVSHGES